MQNCAWDCHFSHLNGSLIGCLIVFFCFFHSASSLVSYFINTGFFVCVINMVAFTGFQDIVQFTQMNSSTAIGEIKILAGVRRERLCCWFPSDNTLRCSCCIPSPSHFLQVSVWDISGSGCNLLLPKAANSEWKYDLFQPPCVFKWSMKTLFNCFIGLA